ncbi:hypothetical protein BAUCODRAFT_34838 [Baudoinia panamericana UAMH 10762]|uniref:Xylanolytic transcriptional activator regulatory domain-containing protein n=1 Tax=Baudoinia panamericana (strain UAMH 10762) TaxID=717646 RepID=M2MHI8_BAUPA|nr:uncharacterized protein BAUCODRAFT_34838 [Baudoinia panamericana UAMH 10762]EMC96071.1 hypothetical protein BAUCODRAFT_34838 [Baudoinia panamericana UAMH 10762]
MEIIDPLSNARESANIDEFDDSGLGSSIPLTPGSGNPNLGCNMPQLETLWPASDELYALLTTHPSPWDLPSLPPLDLSFIDLPSAEQQVTTEQPPRSSGRARQAMQHLDNLIKDLSFSLSREVERLGVVGDFLDMCMNMFHSRFLAVFPVVHQPTFSVKDCTPPLLLNMIALGSLFVATDGAITRGESLWKLAHTAVATSWHSMLQYQGPEDAMPGVQLILTAFLGQAYALLSRNRSIRLTSHVFHGLGFYWARLSRLPCDMPSPQLPSLGNDAETRTTQWKAWAAWETCNRALLGHYILDGLISGMSGLPGSVRHTTNRMRLPSSEQSWEADSADIWIAAMSEEDAVPALTFRELLNEIFDIRTPLTCKPASHMCIPALLEALQSLVSDSHEAGGESVALPPKSAVSHALWRVYDQYINSSPHLPAFARTDLTIRWHTICIGVIVPLSLLIGGLCNKLNVNQDLFPNAGRAADASLERDTAPARQAILHAVAIADLVQNVPFAKLQALHLPLALLTAEAVLLTIIAGAGSHKVTLPASICWRTVCLHDEQVATTEPSTQATHAYLSAGMLRAGTPAAPRSLTQDVFTLHHVLESLALSWGIAKDMCLLLRRIIAVVTS